MAPKKRKVAAADVQTDVLINPDHVALLNKRLEEIDAAGACKTCRSSGRMRMKMREVRA